MTYTAQQEMFLLAPGSNAGALCQAPNWDSHQQRQQKIEQCVSEKSNGWFSDRGLSDWQIVWGPGVYLVPNSTNPLVNATYPTNVVYVAKHTKTEWYVVSVAGTNPHSLFDLLAEDLTVVNKKPWPYASGSTVPEISPGSLTGLEEVQRMSPGVGPHPNLTLNAFFAEALKNVQGQIKITTTGHSLGGVALSPLVALWLWETRATWFPNGASNPLLMSCIRFAGPSPGDGNFQSYYNERIQDTTSIFNTLDIVAKAWNHATMLDLPNIYKTPNPSTDIPSEGKVLSLILSKTDRVQTLDYQQIGNGKPFTGGMFAPLIDPNPNNQR